MLAKLGKKLFAHLGEDQTSEGRQGHAKISHHSQYVQAHSHLADFHKLVDLLPYDAYDPKTKLFYSQASVGFVVETAPLVGASSEMQREVANLFAMSLPEESSLQVMLWADPHIGDQLDAYQAARSGQSTTLQYVAKERADYLKQFAYDS